jgi:hypothetical protein
MTVLACAWLALVPAGQPTPTLEDLAGRSWPDLAALYATLPAGPLPLGYYRGRPVYDPATAGGPTRDDLVSRLWFGKLFLADGTLINQWRGVQAVKAVVGPGTSWVDGGPAVVMDYRGSSLVWARVRDEMRAVRPGLYLGRMFVERAAAPRFKMFFVLEAVPTDP